jgi:hypothetical protein
MSNVVRASSGGCVVPALARGRIGTGSSLRPWDTPREALMPGNTHIDENLASVVRYALETTKATTVCPFRPNVTIRVGDDAAETHAYIRAHRIVKSDGTAWDRELLLQEFKRQLDDAADGACPDCAGQSY